MMQGSYPSRRTHPVNTGVSPTKTHSRDYRPVGGVTTSETPSAPANEYPVEYPEVQSRTTPPLAALAYCLLPLITVATVSGAKAGLAHSVCAPLTTTTLASI